jgi:hypothetical protein
VVAGELVVPSWRVVVDEESEPDSVVEGSVVAVHAEKTNANTRNVIFVVFRTVSPRGLWFIQ